MLKNPPYFWHQLRWFYFFLTGLSALEPHFLQRTLPCVTFMLEALILVLHFLQTKMFLNNLASASGIFAILSHLKWQKLENQRFSLF